MLLLVILIGYLSLPFNYAVQECNFDMSEVCCTWSYDICDIQPSKEDLAADPDINKEFKRWCFSFTSFSWEEEPGDWDIKDDHDEFLRNLSPEERENFENHWDEGCDC